MDFSQDELLEAIERLVNGLLERAGVTEPPVDALHIAEGHLGIPVEGVKPAGGDGRGGGGPRARAATAVGIALTSDMGVEQQQKAAAEGIARALFPDVLRRLG